MEILLNCVAQVYCIWSEFWGGMARVFAPFSHDGGQTVDHWSYPRHRPCRLSLIGGRGNHMFPTSQWTAIPRGSLTDEVG